MKESEVKTLNSSIAEYEEKIRVKTEAIEKAHKVI
jgi:hypothetical protein